MIGIPFYDGSAPNLEVGYIPELHAATYISPPENEELLLFLSYTQVNLNMHKFRHRVKTFFIISYYNQKKGEGGKEGVGDFDTRFGCGWIVTLTKFRKNVF